MMLVAAAVGRDSGTRFLVRCPLRNLGHDRCFQLMVTGTEILKRFTSNRRVEKVTSFSKKTKVIEVAPPLGGKAWDRMAGLVCRTCTFAPASSDGRAIFAINCLRGHKRSARYSGIVSTHRTGRPTVGCRDLNRSQRCTRWRRQQKDTRSDERKLQNKRPCQLGQRKANKIKARNVSRRWRGANAADWDSP